MNIGEIACNIKEHNERIFEILSEKEWQHFKWYFFIAENYQRKNFDDIIFRKKFAWFYGMRGMTRAEKAKFFGMFCLDKKTDFETILKELSKYRGRIFLSFVTKLLHTQNKKLPIYDSRIACVLKLQKQEGSEVDEKINNREQIYSELREDFKVLLRNPQIRRCLADKRKELQDKARSENFLWQDKLLSEEKLLDSILWALHAVLQSPF